ncbi:2'-5' RNA ligase family protein [Actinomycetospora termitidis]|uniref:RNA 2',3'-cyclic phosphodiesterase n=1 Tax=Actinomycetospora termitidis TaxID=3053470 RepID=A0ABT7M7Y8_9PSEU|nr:RNA 2',3'-cyclic phosphodiesterase [Actinomycetospora sp. Odt1-22]MDL5156299.1 RNA 2',3'-cyclic phosphodiesterase [Actinomycetospora sp. Odt1-22]
MRLFVAVLPDEAANAAADTDLELALRRDPHGGRWRAVARERRHVTLRFHADADPDEVAAELGERLAGGERPALRCAGAGRFGTALWLGVETVGAAAAWDRLLVAAGADPAEHVAHLTVARARGRSPSVPPGLAEHRGPVWTPDEVVVVASGTPYRVVARFPLVGGDEAVGPGR